MDNSILNSSNIEKPLNRAVVWPIVAALLLSIFLLIQVNQLIKASQMVDHSDQVMAEARKARGYIVDTQSHLQSFILFRENYRLVQLRSDLQNLPSSLDTLKGMVSDNPAQISQVNVLKNLETQWQTRAKLWVVASPWTIKHLKLIDNIRTQFDKFIDDEEKLRTIRVQESQDSGRRVLNGGVFLLVGLGLFCSLFTKRVLKRMSRQHKFLLQEAQLNLDRLSHLATELKHAVEVRDDFLSIASHELKTPLTSLKLQIHSVKRTLQSDKAPNPARIDKALSIFGGQVTRLTELIENLLDLTKLKQGQLRLELAKINFSALVIELTDRIAEQWKYQPPLLQMDVESDVEVFCDRFRMEQVVINLLSNAMKYGEGKVVKVQLKTVDNHCALSIVDHGIGIEKNKQDSIFERYERAVSHKHIGGLGLGLYIARQNVVAHHGSIEVASRIGVGSTFTMKIPLMPTDIQGAEPRREQVAALE